MTETIIDRLNALGAKRSTRNAHLDALGIGHLPEFLPLGKKSNVPTYLTKDLVWVACKKYGIVLGLLSVVSFRGIEVALFRFYNLRLRVRNISTPY